MPDIFVSQPAGSNPQTSPAPRKALSHLSMIGAEVLWGISAPVGKVILAGGIAPMILTDMRLVGAALLFWIVSLFMPREKVSRRDLGAMFVASLLAITGNQVSFLIGLEMTSPINASIIPTSLPILTMLLAAIVLREPITHLKTFGVLVGAIGAVTLIISSGTDVMNTGSVSGDLLILFSQISFSCYLVFYKGLIARYSATTLMKWMFTFSALCVVPFTVGDIASTQWASVETQAAWGCVFYVVGPTFLSYLLLPVGQKHLRPTVTAMYNYVQPVVAVFVAVMMGLGCLTWWNVASMLLVFGGVFMVTKSRARDHAGERVKGKR